MMFDLILDVMNGFLAKIGSIVPLGRGYFPRHSRHLYVFSAIWRLVVEFFAGVQILLVSKKRTR
jgi:hypothetical protein